MSDFPHDDPDWQAFADHAIEDLVPKLDASAYAVALVPRKPENRTDIKFCVEIGMMLMLDKPIIMVVAPGTKVPDKLIQVADLLIELSTDDERFQERLMAAISEMQDRLGLT